MLIHSFIHSFICLLINLVFVRSLLMQSNHMTLADLTRYRISLIHFKSSLNININELEYSLNNQSISYQNHLRDLSYFLFDKSKQSIVLPPNLIGSITTQANLDLWLTLQFYYQSSIDWEANLLAYQAFVHQQRKLALITISKVSSLLQATIKVFAHEQVRAWSDSSAILTSISNTIVSLPTIPKFTEILTNKQESNTISQLIEEPIETSAKTVAIPSHFRISFSELSSSYHSIFGHIKYSLIQRNTWKHSSNNHNNNRNSTTAIDSFEYNDSEDYKTSNKSNNKHDIVWFEGYAVITFSGQLHIFPNDVRIHNQLLVDRMTTILSINNSSIFVEPMLIPLPGSLIDDNVFMIHSNNPNEKITVQTLTYQLQSLNNNETKSMSSRITSSLSLSTTNSNSNTITANNHIMNYKTNLYENIALQFNTAVESSNWMRLLSNPFIDIATTDDILVTDECFIGK